jgi:DNA polymerase-3 subunit chi
MTEIAFYHLQKSPLETVLPRLLMRTLDSGKRAIVMAGSEERVETLTSALWTFDQDAWLPHGNKRDGRADEQPIWLTTVTENPNGATYLFLTDGVAADEVGAFERCFDLFDGNDPAAVEAARARWSALKAAGHTLTYWQQDERGAWKQRS